MRCKNCNEEVNFLLIKVTAKWDDSKQKWDRSKYKEEDFIGSSEGIMCETCHSFNVTERK